MISAPDFLKQEGLYSCSAVCAGKKKIISGTHHVQSGLTGAEGPRGKAVEAPPENTVPEGRKKS